MPFTQHLPLHDRLLLAVKRRGFLTALCVVEQLRPGLHRVTCEQSGAWVEFDTTGWRIRAVAEHAGEPT